MNLQEREKYCISASAIAANSMGSNLYLIVKTVAVGSASTELHIV